LDTAKAVGLMVNASDPLMSYIGLGKVKHYPIPIVAVPTTAGTGSEVTLWSVFTDDETGVKVAIGDVKLYPQLAVCDPQFTLSLPPALTASTGMDALAHAIECYTNNACQPISGSLALTAIELLGRNLRAAVIEGRTNVHARYQVLLASTMAGLAMNSTRLGLVHALAMPLGSQPFRIPHGVANAITLPHVMAFNSVAEPERFASVASALAGANEGQDLAGQAAEAVRKLAEDIGIPSGLSAVGFREEAIPAIVAEAMKSGNVPVNPRPAGPEDLEKILRAAL
ncbi:MAG TPA: iron-containing alcohol dehydrogenase, partial [Acidobacteriota bacterium]|nr:iron-containing alcohol dehydrogenase [Acidobacteriota bacterium]